MYSVSIDEKKKTVTIVLPLTEPTPSKSGKLAMIAGTGGFTTTETVFRGEAVKINVNVGVKPTEKVLGV